MTNEKAIKNVTYMRNSLDPLSERKLIESLDMAIEALRKKDQALNEWCTDCKEYDQERHCCPRFNRVIESAIKDATDTNVGDTVSRQAAIVTLHDEILRRRLNNIEPIDEFDTESILRQLPSAQPETCEGCKHLGKWENEVEYGYPSPCTRCKRRAGDHYER